MVTPSSSDGPHPNGVNAVCFALREASNNYLAGSETGVSCPTFLAIFIQSSFAREVLPSFIATTSSCATPDPLTLLSFALYKVPLPLVPSTAGHQELPDFILLIFPEVPRPLPRRSIGCS